MFHQVRLLPEDKPLLRFVWRDLKRDMHRDIYEWQVLPFGMTCSPCCATFGLQQHFIDHSIPDEDVRFSVERCFYVDNCLQSIPSAKEARQLLDKLQALLSSGGFEIRQWTSNVQSVVSHLPQEALSDNTELWLSQDRVDMQEATLGLRWHCPMDQPDVTHDVHIFCDASERAYGSAAYLRTEDSYGNINLAFLMARSRVAPRRQHSMPRLELCTAVTGAQLAKLIKTELTLPLRGIVLWTDSTTVLSWLQNK